MSDGNLWRIVYSSPIGWCTQCFVEADKHEEVLADRQKAFPDLEWKGVEETKIPRADIIANPFRY